jgi:GT2 family glycosyltransferase
MISLIIPNFNKRRYLAQTLASASAQECVSQIIVVDDASTDGSQELIADAAHRDARIDPVFLQTNRNASHCRNRGLERADGEYVIFIDSDDALAPGCCRSRLERARKAPDHDAWVFPMQVFHESIERPGRTWVPGAGDHLRHFLAHRLDWQTMQPLWRRTFVQSIDGFDESFRRLQDPEFHVRALLAGARVHCARDTAPDCFYRIAHDRHVGNVESISTRHLEGAVHFYDVFADRVSKDLLPFLSGTLFACLTQLTHWWRVGGLSKRAFSDSAARLGETCRIPAHRRLLVGYETLQLLVPLHLPGINCGFRFLLGV